MPFPLKSFVLLPGVRGERAANLQLDKGNPDPQAQAAHLSQFILPSKRQEGCLVIHLIYVLFFQVRQYLNTLYSSGNDATEALDRISRAFSMGETNNNKNLYNKPKMPLPRESDGKQANIGKKQPTHRMGLPGLKQTLCSMFRFRKIPTPAQCMGRREVTHFIAAELMGNIKYLIYSHLPLRTKSVPD